MRIKSIHQSYLKVFVSLFLVLAISSCGGDTGTVTGPEEPDKTETPSDISSSFETEDTTFQPGEIQVITIEGTALTTKEYSARIADGEEVILYGNGDEGNSLLFIVPETAVDDYELIFTLKEQEQSLEFSIEEYEIIEEPVEFVTTKKDQISQQLELVISQATDQELKDLLEASLSDLDQAMEDLATLDISEQSIIAYVIREHLAENTAAKSKSIQDTSCDDVKMRLWDSPEKVATVATAGVSGGFWGGLKGVIINAFATTKVFNIISSTIDDIGYLLDNCAIPEFSMESKLKAAGPFTFHHGEVQTFAFNTTKSLDDEIIGIIDDLKNNISPILQKIPDKWVDYLFGNDFMTTEPADASLLTLSEISDSEITGEIFANESDASFTFFFSEMPVDDRSFSFIVGDEQAMLEVEAELKPAAPIAYGMQITAAPGETTKDTLRADFAASFTIDSLPAHGTLTLLDAEIGVFEYQPDEGFIGTDSFTYFATNSSDSSEVATVTLKVEADGSIFGTWKYVGQLDVQGEYIGIYENGAAPIIFQKYRWLGYNSSEPNRSECWYYYSDNLYHRSGKLYNDGRGDLVEFTFETSETMIVNYAGQKYRYIRATTAEVTGLIFCPGL